MSDRGQIPGCYVDGPLAIDVALSQEAVKIKKLESKVAGDADCLVLPSIEAANVFYKTNTQLVSGIRVRCNGYRCKGLRAYCRAVPTV